ncbi:MAG: Ig-like domain-containing protein, partial [Prevotella sp.]|nr:Ig-like domain-containing protein [Prevotella sp.]
LSPTSASVVNGRTTKMTAIRRTFTNGTQTYGEDYSSNFTWTSSNTSVATVGSNGVITGVGAGTATITAKYGGTTLTGTVTVTPNYTYELVLNKTSIDMGKGRTETLVATYKTYADGVLESSKDVTSSATWSSSSSSVAGVSGGTITGNGVGSATITATYNGKSATCSVKVTGSPALSLGWTSADLEKGDVRTNAAIYNPNNGTASTNVTSSAVWTTSNSGVATVGGGQITAQGKGTCTITATYNGVSASCTVNVTDNDTPSTNTYVSNMSVQSVNVSGTSNYKLTLSLRFSDGTVVEDAPYTWSVTYAQNTSIATGTSGDAPIVYTGGGSTYVMAVTLTTKEYYYDANGNRRQHTTGTSFSHNVSWTP